MSYNNHLYNNFHGNYFTFRLPPPPLPPMHLFTPQPIVSDENYLKYLESKLVPEASKPRRSLPSISEVKDKLCKLLNMLKELKDQEDALSNNVEALSDEEWNANMTKIKDIQSKIDDIVKEMNSFHFDVLRKAIAKRAAKRLRMKRVNEERKRDKEQRIRALQERSRKIDENLQKIKDDTNKVKQEEEAKIEADIVLKEVLRKKHDAKRSLVKLDAVVRLRKARLNTAKGRGETVSESDSEAFDNNIGRLKSLWAQKLVLYEKEEAESRRKLEQESEDQQKIENDMQKNVSEGLTKWCDMLFGGMRPQVNFAGDFGRFVAVRSEWDKYLDPEGTPLPVGWAVPDFKI